MKDTGSESLKFTSWAVGWTVPLGSLTNNSKTSRGEMWPWLLSTRTNIFPILQAWQWGMFLWKIRVIISLQWWLKFVLIGFAEITPSQDFISLYLDLGNSLFAYLLFSILPHFNIFAAQDLGTPFQYLHFHWKVQWVEPPDSHFQSRRFRCQWLYSPLSKRGMDLV